MIMVRGAAAAAAERTRTTLLRRSLLTNKAKAETPSTGRRRDTIVLKGLSFFGRHGVLEEEKILLDYLI